MLKISRLFFHVQIILSEKWKLPVFRTITTFPFSEYLAEHIFYMYLHNSLVAPYTSNSYNIWALSQENLSSGFSTR